MVNCDICQREFKTSQALSGHRRFKHNSELGVAAAAAGELAREDTQWLLNADIQMQLDRNREILESLGERLDQLMTSAQSVSRNTDSVTLLSTKLDELAATVVRQAEEHKPGFCEERICSANCHTRLIKERSDTVDLIDHKLPNTKENLRQLEVAMRNGDILKFPVAANIDLLDQLDRDGAHSDIEELVAKLF